ncbi:MAG TPA: PqqD family protein [Allocoleopsis sp.]
MTNNSFKVNAFNVVYESIEGETLLLNLETRTYYSMLNTAGKIWEYIEKGFDQNVIIMALSQIYDTDLNTLKRAINNFIIQLRQENLIINNPSSTNITFELKQELKEKLPFTPPVIEKHTDLQNIYAGY